MSPPPFRFCMQTANTPQPLAMHHVQNSSFAKFQCHTNVIIHLLARNQVLPPNLGPWSLRLFPPPNWTPHWPMPRTNGPWPFSFSHWHGAMPPLVWKPNPSPWLQIFWFLQSTYLYLDLALPTWGREQPQTEEKQWKARFLYLREEEKQFGGGEQNLAKPYRNAPKLKPSPVNTQLPIFVRPIPHSMRLVVSFKCI